MIAVPAKWNLLERYLASRVIFIDQVIAEEGKPEIIFTQPKEERTKNSLQRYLK